MAPSFRADHIGSLLRPASLLEARKSRQLYSDTALSSDIAAATKAAIGDAVKKQLELSVRPITSGEYERTIFYSGFFEKLEGMKTKGLPIPDGFRTGLPSSTVFLRMGRTMREANIAIAPIRRNGPAYLEAWEMLKSVTPPEHWGDCKMTLPSITMEHSQLAHGTAWAPGVYASDREYFADLAAAYRAEFKDLYDAGLRHVQIDSPNLSVFFVDSVLEGCRTDGINVDEFLDLHIWAHNEMLRGRPAGMRIGLHMCRGNMSRWDFTRNTLHCFHAKSLMDGSPYQPLFHDLFQGSYETIAEKMFTKLNYDQFYLEYDDPARQGSFAPLRFLPRGKSVVLGIVSTKTAEPDDVAVSEDIDVLEARVREAAAVIAKGQGRSAEEVLEDTLAVSPQCGFASLDINVGKGFTEEKMWAKLVLLRDLARRLWKDAV
ncbi:Methionine vitamin-b12 [Mycena sanguinolenta]|uniref:Methionine vitamin-b12 n=1 Tax=Mycena sanguinolenta TaxID=230812 RepID=A0A8H7DLG4_9AGAR|nr:Methionine vitamin-b12 [Mycena sanguinolenta]